MLRSLPGAAATSQAGGTTASSAAPAYYGGRSARRRARGPRRPGLIAVAVLPALAWITGSYLHLDAFAHGLEDGGHHIGLLRRRAASWPGSLS